MDIDVKKNNLCINSVVAQKTENIIIEGDAIIPDIKPDILNAINTDGTICIYKKEVLDGKIKLEGCINTNVMYLADNEESGVRGFSTNIDFVKFIEIEKAKSGMDMECDICLKNIECKIVNGRKIAIKAIAEVTIQLTVNRNVEFIEDINNLQDIQKLNKKIMVNSMLGSGETRCFAKDTVVIDNIDNLAEIMKTDIEIINKETKVSYNKVLVKADLKVKIMYITEDNRINCVNTKIPIMGFIDIQNITESNICEIKYCIKNLSIKPNNAEEHSIYVEAEVEVKCNVFEEKEIELIEDLYSTSVNLRSDYIKLATTQSKANIENTCMINKKENIPELRNQKIYDTDISVNIQKQSNINGKVCYEGEITVNFIYSSNRTGGIDTKKIVIPFEHSIEIEGLNNNTKIDTSIEVKNQDFIIQDETAQVKLDINFCLTIYNNVEISVINNIDIDKSNIKETYSLVVYFVKPGDTLWKIAKKFGSTIEDISQINEIVDIDNINVGDELFVPKATNQI